MDSQPSHCHFVTSRPEC